MATTDEVRQKSDENMWAMFCHLSALAGFVGVPFGNIIGPLVVWLVKKDGMPAVDDQGKESLNFQITVTICLAACFLLAITVIGLVIAIPGFIIVGVGSLVLVILASIKANNGEAYRYPCTIRFLK